MCMFCAAVPMTAALGAAATAKQKRNAQQPPNATPVQPSVRKLPAEQITLVVIGGLLVGSVVYHSQLG